MKRTQLLLAVTVCAVMATASAARADGYLILNGGALLPTGDDDWVDLVEPSASFAVRGGGNRRVARNARVAFEAGLEYAPLATDFNSPLFELDVTRFRFLLGARYEQLLSRGLLLSLRGGLGLSHLRAEVSTVLGGSDSDSDTGLALDLAAGLWFAAGPVLVGAEFGLPMGFHSDEDSATGATLDYRMTEIAMSAGVRFHL